MSTHPELDNLIATAHTLRNPGGCPWDAEQTHESLVQYLLEETFELIEALESGNRDEVIEELGDVLYQVIFHSDLASTGSLGEPFDIEDVARVSAAKMRGRHPHVFGTPEELEKYAAKTGDDVMLNWDSHKKREKPERMSVLDGIPEDLPALARANKVLGKAEKLGLFDADAPGAFSVTSEDGWSNPACCGSVCSRRWVRLRTSAARSRSCAIDRDPRLRIAGCVRRRRHRSACRC